MKTRDISIFHKSGSDVQFEDATEVAGAAAAEDDVMAAKSN
jgi:hypothetical protein